MYPGNTPGAGDRPSPPTNQDREHLRILSILHYVFGGLGLLISCLPLGYVGMGAVMLANPGAFEPDEPPPAVGWMFVGMGFGCFAFGLVLSLGVIMAGRNLASYNRRTFCMVMAGLCCLSVPLGTLLGVFTLIVLSRPSVKQMFDEHAADARFGV